MDGLRLFSFNVCVFSSIIRSVVGRSSITIRQHNIISIRNSCHCGDLRRPYVKGRTGKNSAKSDGDLFNFLFRFRLVRPLGLYHNQILAIVNKLSQVFELLLFAIMNQRTEESIRDEIREIESIPYRDRSADDKKRLNDLEDELLRRRPELQTGEFLSILFPNVFIIICSYHITYLLFYSHVTNTCFPVACFPVTNTFQLNFIISNCRRDRSSNTCPGW